MSANKQSRLGKPLICETCLLSTILLAKHTLLIMHRRANYHPHSRASLLRHERLATPSRVLKQDIHAKQGRHQAFHAKFGYSNPKTFVQDKIVVNKVRRIKVKAKTVVVRVERPGSGIDVGTATLLIDGSNIWNQLALQVTALLNEPYGTARQHSLACPWRASDYELFAGHNFDDKDLISDDDERARFQVCCLAFCDIPVVVFRKTSAVWVDVKVRNNKEEYTVSNVRPVSLVHIVQACIPNGEVKDYKVTFDGSEEAPTLHPPNLYICDASCRVVVECLSVLERKERRLYESLQRQREAERQGMLNISLSAGSLQTRQAFRIIEMYREIDHKVGLFLGSL
jgi:hypothetical protein